MKSTMSKNRCKKRESPESSRVTAKSPKMNAKRSRYLKKTDDEILLEILVRAEKAGSFCPEKLMRVGSIGVFEEAYRRFETWDVIVEKCVAFSNDQNLIGKRLMPPKEIVLEILRLESRGESFREAAVLTAQRELHDAALMFYGSWDSALAVVGIKRQESIRDPP